jgi:hypothetical protein
VLCLCNILSQSSRIWPVYTIWQVWRKLSHERRLVALECSYIICIWTLPIANIYIKGWVRVMVFKDTFNNISVISWRSVLLVEETGVPAENHRPVASHWQTLSPNFVSSKSCLSGKRTHNINGDRNWSHRRQSGYKTVKANQRSKAYSEFHDV